MADSSNESEEGKALRLWGLFNDRLEGYITRWHQQNPRTPKGNEVMVTVDFIEVFKR